MEKIESVAIIGAGFMGLEIAVLSAKRGKNVVTIYDLNKEVIEKAQKSLEEILVKDVSSGTISQEIKCRIIESISFDNDLNSAVRNADLVIEAIPERLQLKRKLFQELDEITPQKTILGTNSSSYPVSKIEAVTKRLDRVVNLHFYPPVERRNVVDVLGGTQTSDHTMGLVTQWVRSLGSYPIKLNKELIGFCFNRIQHTARLEAMKMWAGGFVDFRDIDRAWMICNGSSMGIFGLMDYVGLDVVYAVHCTYFDEYGEFYKPPQALKDMVDRKELGMKTGKGFYTYPNPEYADSDFLKP